MIVRVAHDMTPYMSPDMRVVSHDAPEVDEDEDEAEDEQVDDVVDHVQKQRVIRERRVPRALGPRSASASELSRAFGQQPPSVVALGPRPTLAHSHTDPRPRSPAQFLPALSTAALVLVVLRAQGRWRRAVRRGCSAQGVRASHVRRRGSRDRRGTVAEAEAPYPSSPWSPSSSCECSRPGSRRSVSSSTSKPRSIER